VLGSGVGFKFKAKTVPSLLAPPYAVMPYRVEPLSVKLS